MLLCDTKPKMHSVPFQVTLRAPGPRSRSAGCSNLVSENSDPCRAFGSPKWRLLGADAATRPPLDKLITRPNPIMPRPPHGDQTSNHWESNVVHEDLLEVFRNAGSYLTAYGFLATIHRRKNSIDVASLHPSTARSAVLVPAISRQTAGCGSRDLGLCIWCIA